MSRRRWADYKVGYKRPPEHTRWKKGQCGNPKRQYRRPLKGTAQLIDARFGDQIDIIENGVPRRVTVFEAILLQLWIKEMSGDKRATVVRLKYQEFVSQQSGPSEILVEGNAGLGQRLSSSLSQGTPQSERI